MDKEITEAKRKKFCDSMKTRKDTAICEETYFIWTSALYVKHQQFQSLPGKTF